MFSTLALLQPLLAPSVVAEPGPMEGSRSYSAMVKDAVGAFEAGDYLRSEAAWRKAAKAYPSEPLSWANLAVALVINASGEMTLGVEPSGRARERLEEALAATAEAEVLGSVDAILLNTRGNALGLLLRWREAAEAYAGAREAAARDFESIPASNEALARLELGELPRAESIVRRILRRDPNFVDAKALLATLRWLQEDKGGAANAIATLCQGDNGPMWCGRYSTEDVVLGRWTPTAVRAYRQLLQEPSIALELRNGRAGI